MSIRAFALAAVVTLLTSGLVLAGTGPDPPTVTCPGPDPLLPGAPTDVPRGPSPAPLARTDPDGFTTLTLAVEDPPDVPGAYDHRPLPDPTGLAPARPTGIFVHPWPSDQDLVTVGVYFDDGATRVRVPTAIVEGFGTTELASMLLVLAADETGSADNALTLLGRGLIAPAGPFRAVAEGSYTDRPPAFVWLVHRTTPDGTLWAGLSRTHEGSSLATHDGDVPVDQFCRRTQVDAVVRTGDGTTERVAGVYVLDEMQAPRDVDPSGTARHRSYQHVTVGARAAGTDVPVTTLSVDEDRRGPVTGYADHQRNEVALGVHLDDGHHKLVGLRSDFAHDDAPESENRMTSVGVYDRNGGYHPIIGVRDHVETAPRLVWLSDWLGAGGPGAQEGDWEIDVGTFDPWGRFTPHVGVTYDDTLDQAGREHATGIEARWPYQALVTAGPWVSGTYVPLVGSSYDGEQALIHWAGDNLEDRPEGMGQWLTSVGAFAPTGGYVPATGVSFTPETDGDGPVEEAYRVGVFTGTYPDFVPLAGADWNGERTSLSWAVQYALDGSNVPANATLDVGVETPATGFVPLVRVNATPGPADRYTVSPWPGGPAMAAIEACLVPARDGVVAAGLALDAEGTRVGVGAVGLRGLEPGAAPGGDCQDV